MKNEQQRQAAIKLYKDIKTGNVKGITLYKPKSIKVGSITFII